MDADFVAMVAARAKDIGDSQVQAANRAAAAANDQAKQAADAARDAQGEIAPAYQAASEAANSAAEAARQAAAAQQSAAAAAVDGAAARAVAAQANALDAEAQADALAARAAANQAAADAALAGRAADQAEADARAARQAANNATRAANEASAAATRAERDAAAAKAAADQAQIDAEEARKAAQRAQDHAAAAEESAKNAEGYAKDAEQSAANAEASARDVVAMLAQIQEQLRRENEERQRREVEQALNDDSEIPDLTPQEEQALREAKGQPAVDEFRRARADANKKVETLIIEQGGQILLDLIGFTDAKRCFMEGDFISCVMTVLNALPIFKLARVLTKIPDAVSATVRIVKGLRTFKDVVTAGRRLAKEIREFIQRYLKCKTGSRSAASAPVCEVDTRPKTDPTQSPKPDTRPNPFPFPRPQEFPDKKEEDKDKSCSADSTQSWAINTVMQPFSYQNATALKATGGMACIVQPRPRPPGSPFIPPGYIHGVHHAGHLIGAALHGTHGKENIVPQFARVNTPVINFDVEGPIRRAARNGETVYLTVLPYYADKDDAVPETMYFYAYGLKGTFRCIAMVPNIADPPRTKCL